MREKSLKQLRRAAWVLAASALLPLALLAQDYGGGMDSGGGFNSGFGSQRQRSGSSGPFGSRNRGSDRYSNQRTDVDKTRDQQQRDQTRNRNSNQPGTRNQRTPSRDKSQQGNAQAHVKGKDAPAGKPKAATGAAAAGGGARATTNVEFKMRADPSTNLLFVESTGPQPTMNITVGQGQKFSTRVAFRNARRLPFRSVDISLKYDPAIVRPLGVDDSGIADLLVAPAIARVDTRKGIVYYHGQLAEPLTRDEMTLIKLQWSAVAPTGHTLISFLNNESYPSRVLNGDVNILQPVDKEGPVEVSENSGLLDADITVIPDATTAKRIEEGDGELSGIQLASNISEGTAEGGISLSLRTNQASVAVGGEFLVDVVYNNPKRADLDTVDLRIHFDPKVLQVVDHDTNNWVTRGVNIRDGDHESLPFDYHMKNTAYNNAGEIVYRMGFSDKVRVPSSGVIAQIRFKAIAPAPATEVSFEIDEEHPESGTAVSFLGFNLIGVPGARAQALTNAVVNVN